MIRIESAEKVTNKITYSNYADYDTFPNSIFTCDKCGDKVGIGFKDLHKHRFSKDSNLKGLDKQLMDRLILTMIPKYKLNQPKQIWALTNRDRYLVRIQRIYLRLIGIRNKFLPIPSTKENIPDSFLDYCCPMCNKPIRIYYISFIGGRQAEMGFEIKFVLS